MPSLFAQRQGIDKEIDQYPDILFVYGSFKNFSHPADRKKNKNLPR